MLPAILVFASIFVFSLLGVLIGKFRKEKKQLLTTLFEVLLFVLAVQLFFYLFNAQEILWLFIAIVLYVETRISAAINFKKEE